MSVPFEPNAPYAPTADNRPPALSFGALPFTRDSDWQMSFGERAALIGLLAELRPRLALEIGTAEGGSLRRIAAQSGEVHSIDLDHSPLPPSLPGNVRLHTGDSQTILAPLLERWEADDRALDFALLDGDHSFAGIRHDLMSLLGSAAAARTVILVHDTMNAEVRAGLESVPLASFPHLVHYEPEFVAGYVFREGSARGSAWGGLGLLITDDVQDAARPRDPRPSRYAELFTAVQQLRADLDPRRDEAHAAD